MTPDLLDELLDRSAPATRAADPAGLRAMIGDASRTAKPRRRRIGLAAGALTVLLLGGAGVAAASGDWLWGPGLENPDRSYTYTAPTWGQCEIRFSGYDTHNLFIQADVDRVVDEWFASADVEAAADPYVDKYLAVIEDSQASSGDEITDPRLADLNAWTAHEQALYEALGDELQAHGYEPGALAGSTAHSQVHCEGEDWGGEGGDR
ncbi:hypothetical protein IF188_07605 [Microbacterium sp. NEAU-LLC]|uniref:Uncharacterized protein n=1 Tax=Microbacterium helvum TaxID=2773713 RepID=A0ABR8NLP2_9MICO|nr:hypothetical protein [Microbacterium helvum]MBD3941559.1 hypothetical protein [Microbacterium helvum]